MSEEMNGKASYSREEIRGKIKSNEKSCNITLQKVKIYAI